MTFDFMARFARRFGCTVNLIAGREFDSAGMAAQSGGACSGCGGCSHGLGDMGLAETGVRLHDSVASGLELLWTCPGCGHEVSESTAIFKAAEQAREALADPLCCLCRRKAAA